MAPGCRRSVVQVTNVSSSATSEQLRTLFGYLGVVDELVLYSDERDESSSKVCYIRYQDPNKVDVALHLNNTAFLDRVLIVLPYVGERDEIPDEKYANLVRAPPNTAAGILPRTADWPLDVISMVVGRPGEQVIQTTEPRLSTMSFPIYPPLAPTTDGSRIEEIRRTVLVTNLEPKTTGEQVLEFFNNHAEVRCVRMAGTDSEKVAYVEFTHQPSILKAFGLMGATLNGRQIMIQHSNCAIIKQASNITVVDDGSKSNKENHKSKRTDRGRSKSRSHGRHSGSRHRSGSKKRKSHSKERRRSHSRHSRGRRRSRSRSRSYSRARRHSRSCSRDRRRIDRGRSRSHNRRYRRSPSISDWRRSRSRSRGHPIDRRDRDYQRHDYNYKERDRDRIRDRDRDYDRKRDRLYDRYHDRERVRDRGTERERDRTRDHDRDRERAREHDRERTRDHGRGRDRMHERTKQNERERTHDADHRYRNKTNGREKSKDRRSVSESGDHNKGERKSVTEKRSPNTPENPSTPPVENETSSEVISPEKPLSERQSRNGTNSFRDSPSESDAESALESTPDNEHCQLTSKSESHPQSAVVARPTVLGVKLAGPEDMDYLAFDNETDWRMTSVNNGSSSGNDSPGAMCSSVV